MGFCGKYRRPCFIVLRFTALHRYYAFLQMEGKILHQEKDYNSLYCGGLQYLPGMPALNGFHEPILR